MTKHLVRAGLLLVLTAIPATAQDSGSNLLDSIRQAILLPRVTKDARDLGVPQSDLLAIFRNAREKQISAATLSDLFREENDAIRKNGRIDNFGAFVQQKLDAGLRGRELAAAIHAEHARRGMGKGHDMKDMPGMGHSKAPGKSGDKRDDSPGKSGQGGNKGGGR